MAAGWQQSRLGRLSSSTASRPAGHACNLLQARLVLRKRQHLDQEAAGRADGHILVDRHAQPQRALRLLAAAVASGGASGEGSGQQCQPHAGIAAPQQAAAGCCAAAGAALPSQPLACPPGSGPGPPQSRHCGWAPCLQGGQEQGQVSRGSGGPHRTQHACRASHAAALPPASPVKGFCHCANLSSRLRTTASTPRPTAAPTFSLLQERGASEQAGRGLGSISRWWEGKIQAAAQQRVSKQHMASALAEHAPAHPSARSGGSAWGLPTMPFTWPKLSAMICSWPSGPGEQAGGGQRCRG